jgi:hypothetical protein
MKYPKIQDINLGKFIFPNYWISKSGFSTILNFSKPEIKNIYIPSTWNLIKSFAIAADYDVDLSDKGILGNQLIKLLGGQKNIWPLSHPTIVNLFLSLSNVEKTNDLRKTLYEIIGDEKIKSKLLGLLPRKSLSDKKLSYSNIRSILKKEDIKSDSILSDSQINNIVSWLIHKDVLRQGKKIKCDHCFLDNWISINDFRSSIICVGCGNSIKLPFGIDTIEWDYELNSLISYEIDQGLLIHLFTVYYFIENSSSTFSSSIVHGSYFGLNFLPLTKNKNKKKEIDIALIIDDQLIIGECKISGNAFTDDVIKENLKLAQEINATKIVFSCFENKQQLLKIIEDLKISDYDIIVLGKEELFFQFPGLSRVKEINQRVGHQPSMDISSEFNEMIEHLGENDKY